MKEQFDELARREGLTSANSERMNASRWFHAGHAAAIAAAEAQPALPTQEEIMRLADEYAASQHLKQRAALQAALAGLPKEQP